MRKTVNNKDKFNTVQANIRAERDLNYPPAMEHGSLARAVPIGLIFAMKEDAMMRHGRAQRELTHSHSVYGDAGAVYVQLVAWCFNLGDGTIFR